MSNPADPAVARFGVVHVIVKRLNFIMVYTLRRTWGNMVSMFASTASSTTTKLYITTAL
jgi:hypothetical protein